LARGDDIAILEEIKDKLCHIEQELSEVRRAVEQLNAAQPQSMPQLAQAQPAQHEPVHWPANIKFTDKAMLREAVDQFFTRLGIADLEPPSAEELQERMRQKGVKPEDNLFSRGIIEMREE
jgi:hypothetical protein